jgi:hypothetical protein
MSAGVHVPSDAERVAKKNKIENRKLQNRKIEDCKLDSFQTQKEDR